MKHSQNLDELIVGFKGEILRDQVGKLADENLQFYYLRLLF